MKKAFVILMALLLVLALAACGSNKIEEAPVSSASSTVEQADSETEENTVSENNTATEAEASEPEELPAETENNAAEAEAAETAAEAANTEAETASAPEYNKEETPVENTPVEPEPEEPASDKVLVIYFSATGTTRGVANKIASVTGGDLYEIKAAQEYTDADLDWHDSDSRTTHEQNDPSVRPEIGSGSVSLSGYTTVFIGYPIWWGEEPRIMDTFVESYDFSGITVIPFCTSGGSGIGRSGTNLANNAGSGNWLEGKRLSAGVSESELQTWIEGLK